MLPQALAWLWSVVTITPLAGIFLSKSLLFLAQVNPALAQPIRRTLRQSVFWHLGFWEWVGAGAVFAFLCASVGACARRREQLETKTSKFGDSD